MLARPLTSLVNFPVVDRIHTKNNKFLPGVKIS